MTTPIPSGSHQVINQVIDQVTQGEVRGLKQLTQAERKVLKNALTQLANKQDERVAIDKNIAGKISNKENYHRNPLRSLVKGIARRFFSDYIDTASLAKFIHDNASVIRQNIAQINNPPPPSDIPPPHDEPPPLNIQTSVKPAVKAPDVGKPTTATVASPSVKPSAVETAAKTTGTEAAKAAKHNFTTQQIDQWLFGKQAGPTSGFPTSQLAIKQNGVRMQEKSAPKTTFSQVKMMSDDGKYSSRMAVYDGSITDFKAAPGQKVAIGDSNNGDLLTGCGFAVATAVINAAGPNLQRDLYNQFGVPGVMQVPEGAKEYTQKAYGGIEGRGYAITCDAHDMKDTHNISRIEFMTVPMYDEEGVRNMYREAYEHSKDLDYIVMPMAGMSHPVLSDKPELSAKIATEEFQKFMDRHPESNLKVVFSIFRDKNAENMYESAAKKLDPA